MLLEHAMKVEERVLGNRLCRTVTINEIHFSFMSEKEIVDVFILRRLQEE